MDMIAGWVVCAGLLLLGWGLGAPTLIALMGSLAFGSTAIASAGGSTIPAYAAMAILLIITTARSRKSWRDLGAILKNQPLAYLVIAITIYAVVSAFLFSRLFAGQTLVAAPVNGAITTVRLGPVSGNINQSAFFTLNCVVFLAVGVLLKQGHAPRIQKAFVVWATLNAALGAMDVLGKVAGLGDVLAPIRTAGYVMLTEQAVGNGFVRIAGGFPEASSYAAVAVPAFVFMFMNWRSTGSTFSLAVAAILAALLLLSTSSTAYAGLSILLGLYGLSVVVAIVRGGISLHQIVILMFGFTGLVALTGVYLYDPHTFDPIVTMIVDATVNKTNSESAIERGRWNAMSIQNFLDTRGVGVGLGSTRSSSWPLSVLAQLGFFGSFGFAVAVAVLAWVLFKPVSDQKGSLVVNASAAALAGVITTSFGGSGADPGMIFLIALAIVSERVTTKDSQHRVRRMSRAHPQPSAHF